MARRIDPDLVTAPLHEPAEPVSRTPGALKLALGAALGLVILFPAVWIAWDRIAAGRLSAAIQASADRGEPVRIEDFDREPVPDEHNGSLAVLAAADHVRPMRREDEEQFWPRDFPLTAAQAEVLARHVPAQQAALDLVRQGRLTGVIQTPADLEVWTTLSTQIGALSSLGGTREVANQLMYALQWRLHEGRVTPAIVLLRDTLFVGQVQADIPLLVAQSVSWGIDALGAEMIARYAPVMQLDPANAELAAELSLLIAELLDDGPRRQRLNRALLAERVLTVKYNANRPHGRLEHSGFSGNAESNWIHVAPTRSDHVLAVLLRPLFRHVALHVWLDWPQLAGALSREDYASAQQLMPNVRARIASPIEYPLVNLTLKEVEGPALGRTSGTWFRVMLSRRMAATMLAMRWYEVERGRLPETLADLVPDYLPELPADPYAVDGRSFGYVVSPAGVYIYSVYENGVDDIAAGTWAPTFPLASREWEAPNFIRLYRAPAMPLP